MSMDAGVSKTAVIVEDDPQIRHILAETLEAAGFSTVSVGNGIDGVRAVLSYQPLVTTLDVNMPGIDGFEAARRIRAQSDTYIIMLTGLEDEADVVLGLGAGADEYIVKPFRPRELRARIEALLRRPRTPPTPSVPTQAPSGPSFPGARPAMAGYPQASPVPAPPTSPYSVDVHGTASPLPPSAPAQPMMPPRQSAPAPTYPYVPAGAPAVEPASTSVAPSAPAAASPSAQTPAAMEPNLLMHRDLRLDLDSRIVVVGNREVELTRTEFELLATLMESQRRVRSKADLTLVLRGESYVTSYFVGDADKRAIEAHMTNLRRKLGDDPNNPRYIETVRGVGYRMTSEVAPPA